MRTWRVVRTNAAADAVITAHRCDIDAGGTLDFSRHDPDDPDGYTVLVHAFGPTAWHEVELFVPPDEPPTTA